METWRCRWSWSEPSAPGAAEGGLTSPCRCRRITHPGWGRCRARGWLIVPPGPQGRNTTILLLPGGGRRKAPFSGAQPCCGGQAAARSAAPQSYCWAHDPGPGGWGKLGPGGLTGAPFWGGPSPADPATSDAAVEFRRAVTTAGDSAHALKPYAAGPDASSSAQCPMLNDWIGRPPMA